MKLFFIIALFFTSFFSVSAQGNVFDDVNIEVPYCQNDECGLKEGIATVKTGLDDVIPTETDAATYIQEIVAEVLTYLYFAMVIIIIYAGFVILTAAGDEDKVSKGKKIILFAIIGVVVIFLAGPITDFIFSMFDTAN